MAKPVAVTKKKTVHPLVEKSVKRLGPGSGPRPYVNLTRYVRWPRRIVVQRKRAILLSKLKIPPALNQFRFPVNKSKAVEILRFLTPYRPESTIEKRQRHLKEAEARASGAEPKSKRPERLRYGLDDITHAVEQKKAKFVVIAHDVQPIELVCWLPTLCRKMSVPYAIIKGCARLGTLVHRKRVAAVAICDVRPEHRSQLETLIKSVASEFIDNQEIRRKWGN